MSTINSNILKINSSDECTNNNNNSFISNYNSNEKQNYSNKEDCSNNANTNEKISVLPLKKNSVFYMKADYNNIINYNKHMLYKPNQAKESNFVNIKNPNNYNNIQKDYNLNISHSLYKSKGYYKDQNKVSRFSIRAGDDSYYDNYTKNNQNIKSSFHPIKFLVKRSLGIFERDNIIRLKLYDFSSNKYFIGFVIICTFINSFLLIFETIPKYEFIYSYTNYFFVFVFTIEFLSKIIASGLILGKFTYLENNWHKLDFLILIVSLIDIMPFLFNANIVVLRTLRLFRPLKSMSLFSNMKKFITTLLNSLKDLSSVFVMMLFFYLIFSLFGLLLWSNTFAYRCRKYPYPINGRLDIDYTNNGYTLCGGTNTCNGNLNLCKSFSDVYNAGIYFISPIEKMKYDKGLFLYIKELNWGTTTFNNIASSLYIVFQVAVFEAWTDIMYMLMEGSDFYISLVYFILLIMIISYFILNLTVAVMLYNFQKYSSDSSIQETESLKIKGKKSKEDFNSVVNNTYKISNLNNIEYDKDISLEDKNCNEAAKNAINNKINSNLYHKKAINRKENIVNIKNNNSLYNKYAKRLNVSTALNYNSTNKANNITFNINNKDKQIALKLSEEDLQQKKDMRRKYNNISKEYLKIVSVKKVKFIISKFNKIELFKRLKPGNEYQKKNKCAYVAYNIYYQPFVQYLIYLIIIISCFLLTLERVDRSNEEIKICEIINIVCVSIFSIECILLLIGFGFKNYFLNSTNINDFIITIVSLVEVLIIEIGYIKNNSFNNQLEQSFNNKSVVSSLQNTNSIISVFKILRILRLFKLVRKWQNFQIVVASLKETIVRMVDYSIIFIMFVYIYALFGYQIFNNKLKFNVLTNEFTDDNRIAINNYYNFDNFGESVLSVFQVIIGDNWSKFYFDCIRSSQVDPAIGIFYYISLVLLGRITLLNIFLAYLIDNFQEARKFLKKNVKVKDHIDNVFILMNQEHEQEVERIKTNKLYLNNNNVNKYNLVIDKLKKNKWTLISQGRFVFHEKNEIDFSKLEDITKPRQAEKLVIAKNIFDFDYVFQELNTLNRHLILESELNHYDTRLLYEYNYSFDNHDNCKNYHYDENEEYDYYFNKSTIIDSNIKYQSSIITQNKINKQSIMQNNNNGNKNNTCNTKLLFNYSSDEFSFLKNSEKFYNIKKNLNNKQRKYKSTFLNNFSLIINNSYNVYNSNTCYISKSSKNLSYKSIFKLNSNYYNRLTNYKTSISPNNSLILTFNQEEFNNSRKLATSNNQYKISNINKIVNKNQFYRIKKNIQELGNNKFDKHLKSNSFKVNILKNSSLCNKKNKINDDLNCLNIKKYRNFSNYKIKELKSNINILSNIKTKTSKSLTNTTNPSNKSRSKISIFINSSISIDSNVNKIIDKSLIFNNKLIIKDNSNRNNLLDNINSNELIISNKNNKNIKYDENKNNKKIIIINNKLENTQSINYLIGNKCKLNNNKVDNNKLIKDLNQQKIKNSNNKHNLKEYMNKTFKKEFINNNNNILNYDNKNLNNLIVKKSKNLTKVKFKNIQKNKNNKNTTQLFNLENNLIKSENLLNKNHSLNKLNIDLKEEENIQDFIKNTLNLTKRNNKDEIFDYINKEKNNIAQFLNTKNTKQISNNNINKKNNINIGPNTLHKSNTFKVNSTITNNVFKVSNNNITGQYNKYLHNKYVFNSKYNNNNLVSNNSRLNCNSLKRSQTNFLFKKKYTINNIINNIKKTNEYTEYNDNNNIPYKNFLRSKTNYTLNNNKILNNNYNKSFGFISFNKENKNFINNITVKNKSKYYNNSLICESGGYTTIKDINCPNNYNKINTIDYNNMKEYSNKDIRNKHLFNNVDFKTKLLSYIKHSSLFIFHKNSLIRKICNNITISSWFEYFIAFAIILNCITLILDTPYNDPNSIKSLYIKYSNYVFNFIFLIECIIKVISFSFIFYENENILVFDSSIENDTNESNSKHNRDIVSLYNYNKGSNINKTHGSSNNIMSKKNNNNNNYNNNMFNNASFSNIINNIINLNNTNNFNHKTNNTAFNSNYYNISNKNQNNSSNNVNTNINNYKSNTQNPNYNYYHSNSNSINNSSISNKYNSLKTIKIDINNTEDLKKILKHYLKRKVYQEFLFLLKQNKLTKEKKKDFVNKAIESNNNRKAYLKDFSNIFDFIILILNIIDFQTELSNDGEANFSYFKAIRALRSLRPIKILTRSENLAIIIDCIIHSLPALGKILLAVGTFIFIYSIVGINLFKDTSGYYCIINIKFHEVKGYNSNVNKYYDKLYDFYDNLNKSNTSILNNNYKSLHNKFNLNDDVEAITTLSNYKFVNKKALFVNSKEDCLLLGGIWAYYYENFRNFLLALKTLIELMTSTGWVNVLYYISITSSKWSYIYFTSYIIVGFLFILNLLISVVIDKFKSLKNKTVFFSKLSEEEQEWFRVQKILSKYKPKPKIETVNFNSSKLQKFLFNAVNSKLYEKIVASLIVLSIFPLILIHKDQSNEFSQILENLNYGFIIVFNIELILKLYVFKRIYFRNRWYVFDFVIIIISDLTYIYSILSSKLNNINSYHNNNNYLINNSFNNSNLYNSTIENYYYVNNSLFNINNLSLNPFIDCLTIYNTTTNSYQYPDFCNANFINSNIDYSNYNVDSNFKENNMLSYSSLGKINVIVRTLRILRILRIFAVNNQMRSLVDTLVFIIPTLFNVGIVLFIVLLIYATMGVQFFATLPNREFIHNFNNFRDFGNATILLFRTMTGEGWNDIMNEALYHDCKSDRIYYTSYLEDSICMKFRNTYCVDENYINYYSLIKGEAYSCGNNIAYLYFISFQIIVPIIVMNLFVVIVIEGFSDSMYENENMLCEENIEEFINIWMNYDPKCSKIVKPYEFVMILKELKPPIGYGYDRCYIEEPKERAKNIKKLKHYLKEIEIYNMNNCNIDNVKVKNNLTTFSTLGANIHTLLNLKNEKKDDKNEQSDKLINRNNISSKYIHNNYNQKKIIPKNIVNYNANAYNTNTNENLINNTTNKLLSNNNLNSTKIPIIKNSYQRITKKSIDSNINLNINQTNDVKNYEEEKNSSARNLNLISKRSSYIKKEDLSIQINNNSNKSKNLNKNGFIFREEPNAYIFNGFYISKNLKTFATDLEVLKTARKYNFTANYEHEFINKNIKNYTILKNKTLKKSSNRIDLIKNKKINYANNNKEYDNKLADNIRENFKYFDDNKFNTLVIHFLEACLGISKLIVSNKHKINSDKIRESEVGQFITNETKDKKEKLILEKYFMSSKLSNNLDLYYNEEYKNIKKLSDTYSVKIIYKFKNLFINKLRQIKKRIADNKKIIDKNIIDDPSINTNNFNNINLYNNEINSNNCNDSVSNNITNINENTLIDKLSSNNSSCISNCLSNSSSINYNKNISGSIFSNSKLKLKNKNKAVSKAINMSNNSSLSIKQIKKIKKNKLFEDTERSYTIIINNNKTKSTKLSNFKHLKFNGNNNKNVKDNKQDFIGKLSNLNSGKSILKISEHTENKYDTNKDYYKFN